MDQEPDLIPENIIIPPEIEGPPTPAAPHVIYISDILNSIQSDRVREVQDKEKLDAIAILPYSVIRPALVQWATRGFPSGYVIHEIPFLAPAICSDGVVRNLSEYIDFCSGKTIQNHIAALQTRMPDIAVGFAYSGSAIMIIVSPMR